MANVDKPAGFRVASNPGSYPIYTGLTKSNLTLTPGDAIILLTTGLIDIASATSAAILGVCLSKLTAIATAGQNCMYVPALPTILFSGQCSGTMAQTDIGEKVDIEGTTGIMEINENASSINVAQIVGLEGGITNAIGASARVLFIWTSSQFTGQA